MVGHTSALKSGGYRWPVSQVVQFGLVNDSIWRIAGPHLEQTVMSCMLAMGIMYSRRIE